MAVTDNLGITQLTEGQSQKEVTINTALETLDHAIAGKLTKDVAGAVDVTLTAAEWTYALYEFTGATTADIDIIVPVATRRFSVVNTTTGPPRTITIKTATGTGVILTEGEHMVVEQSGDLMTPLTGSSSGGGGGETSWSRTDLSTSSPLLTGLLAFWRMEEATGDRVDTIASMALTPQGTTAQITTAVGKTGNALRFLGGAGAYLSIADNATLSVGTSSFTVGFWLYVDGTPASGWGLVGKGDVSTSNNGAEYLFWINGTSFEFVVGSGSSHVVRIYPGVTPTTGTWYFLVGWYDAALDTQYFQVNNGTVASVANTAGSFDSTAAFEIGRQVGWSGSPTVNMRVDNLCFYKRILSDAERTQHWNSGNSLEPPFTVPSYITPTEASDRLVLATTPATTERLEVDGGIKLGNSTGTVDGTIRWTGTDLEVRKAGAWVSLTT